MSDYLDASVIVAALVPETHSARADAFLATAEPGALFASAWVATEVSSALSIKVRVGAIDADARAQVLAVWQAMRRADLGTVPMTDAMFETAARFVERAELGLRAGDALHLAIAASAGHRVIALDNILLTAGPRLGVAVIAP